MLNVALLPLEDPGIIKITFIGHNFERVKEYKLMAATVAGYHKSKSKLPG